VMLVLVLVGAAIGAVVWSRTRSSEGILPAPVSVEGVTAEVVDAGVAVAAIPLTEAIIPVVVDAGVAAPTPPPRRKTKSPIASAAVSGYEVRIVTEPAGATVLRDGSSIGSTPLAVRLAPGESAALVIKKQGFLDRQVSVQEDSPAQLKLNLVPVW
jgi:hypothetical protein